MKTGWPSRRWLLAGTGTAIVGSLAAAAYRVSPRFWKQMANEMGREILPPTVVPHPKHWPDRGLHAAWLGHSTVLLKIDGYTILTDPVFSPKAGLSLGPVTLGVKRFVYPAVDLHHLPPLDLVLISHAHMDHFDIPSLRALENRSRDVVTAWGTEDLLRTARYRTVRSLRWDETIQSGPVRLRAIEVNHWGARMRNDTWRGYNGYLLEAGRYRVLFAGDTANTDLFRHLASQRGIDLAIMPIGAYNPWIRYHCTPEQAWRMGNEARANYFMPVHHKTFRLSNEPMAEPIDRFLSAAGSSTDRVVLHDIGGEFHLT